MTEFGKSELFTVDQLRDVGRQHRHLAGLAAAPRDGRGRPWARHAHRRGHLTSKLGEMQHRAELYDLIDYEGYNHFDTRSSTSRSQH